MRFEISANAGACAANEWFGSFEDAGYEEVPNPRPDEIRMHHPGGCIARIFQLEGLDSAYIYPPGGTDHPTGRCIIPRCFKPKKKATNSSKKAGKK